MITTEKPQPLVTPKGFDPEDDLDRKDFADGKYRVFAWTFQIQQTEYNPRTFVAETDLEELKTSLKIEQKQDLVCREVSVQNKPWIKWEAVGGNTRHTAAEEEGIERLWILVKPIPNDQRLIHLEAMADNGQRVGLTLYDLSNACARQIKLGTSLEDIEIVTGEVQSRIIMLAKFSNNLHPDLMVLLDRPTLKDNRIVTKEANELCRLPKEEQKEVHKAARRHYSTSSTKRGELINSALATRKRQTDRLKGGGKILSKVHVPTVAEIIGNNSRESIGAAAAAIKEDKMSVGGKAGVILSAEEWSAKARQILDMQSHAFNEACLNLTPTELVTFYGHIQQVGRAIWRIEKAVKSYAEKHNVRLD